TRSAPRAVLRDHSGGGGAATAKRDLQPRGDLGLRLGAERRAGGPRRRGHARAARERRQRGRHRRGGAGRAAGVGGPRLPHMRQKRHRGHDDGQGEREERAARPRGWSGRCVAEKKRERTQLTDGSTKVFLPLRTGLCSIPADMGEILLGGKRPQRRGRLARRLFWSAAFALAVGAAAWFAFRRATGYGAPDGEAPVGPLAAEGTRLTFQGSSVERVGALWVLRGE